MVQHRYWVIGGEFTCLEFKALKDDAPRVAGPFVDEAEARETWRRMSREHSSNARVRFSIATEAMRTPT